MAHRLRASAPRGLNDEFLTLVPPSGDDYLRVQRLEAGPAGLIYCVTARSTDSQMPD